MITRITSISNPRINLARKLFDHKHRKQEGLFLAEGLKAVGQAFDSAASIQSLIFAPTQLQSRYGNELLDKAKALDLDILEVPDYVLESLARKDKPQGILAVIKQNWSFLDDLEVVQGLWIGLDSIQNPGNLGTILRTCDAVGASGLILIGESTDPYDPAAVKASMGSIFTVPHYKLTKSAFIKWLNSAHSDLGVYGSSDKAKQDYALIDYPKDLLLLMGSERQGLSQALQGLCTKMLAIPMQGSCDSLNLAVATALIAYQIYNNMRSKRV
jgi:TrmH family RNA methyltransferase